MSKSQDRRLDKVAKNLSTPQRVRAVLDATAHDDQAVISHLFKTAPVFRYDMTDQKLCNAINAAEVFALRVDRAFFHTYMRRWRAIAYLDAPQRQDDEAEAPEEPESPLAVLADAMAFVRAIGIVATRVQLDLEELLAFSAAVDTEEWQDVTNLTAEGSDSLREAIEAVATPIADELEKWWRDFGGYAPSGGMAAVATAIEKGGGNGVRQ